MIIANISHGDSFERKLSQCFRNLKQMQVVRQVEFMFYSVVVKMTI